MDAQSVKNTDTAGQKGYDAGKKVSGIKRHIAVDTQGLPHAVAVTTAEVTDRKGALAAFDRCADNLKQVTSVLVDFGHNDWTWMNASNNTNINGISAPPTTLPPTAIVTSEALLGMPSSVTRYSNELIPL